MLFHRGLGGLCPGINFLNLLKQSDIGLLRLSTQYDLLSLGRTLYASLVAQKYLVFFCFVCFFGLFSQLFLHKELSLLGS